MKTAGRSVPRIEGRAKVTGQAVFAAETPVESPLHAVLVQAPIARGRIASIDAEQVRTCPGFADLVTWQDAETLRPVPFVGIAREPIVHFAGQPIALVVGETALQVQRAAVALRVDYVEEPAVTSITHPLAEPYAPDMCGARAKAYTSRGDPGTALASADIVLRRRYETAVNNHHPLEPHAAVCEWKDDELTVYTCTQAVFGTRAVLAAALAVPPEKIRVIAHFLGGGFGCKGQLWWPYLLLAILAARRTRRPVRLELTRAQMFSVVGRRSETVQDLAIGASRDGQLTAIDHAVLAQTSTHAEYADPVAYVSRLLYACPNVVTQHHLVRTNEPHGIPMRGPGEAPGSFALESALDELADQLGIDPVELRLRNYADHDQDAGRPWSSNSLRECLTQGAERFGWNRRPRVGWTEGHLKIGWGVAVANYPARRQPARSRVRIDQTGSVTVSCGTQDMGSGTYTALAQLAAEGLGVPVESLAVELGDTLLPQGPFSGGSQVTQSVAPAVGKATAALRRRLAALAVADRHSPLRGLDASEIEVSEGLLRVAGGNASQSITDLIGRGAPDGLEAEGEDAPLIETVTGMGFGAVFVEVDVDPDLGEIRIRRICAAYAAGHIVNPLLARSQYVSGLIGGIGMALHEQTLTDRPTGQIIGDTLADYLVPVHADMPDFEIILVDEEDRHLPHGIKGVGMLGHVGTSAAIANAVFHATGRRVRHLPIRIEDIVAPTSASSHGER